MKKTLVAAACLTFLLAGCEPSKPDTTTQNARQVEQNQQRLQTAQPAPVIDVSAERKNLIDRLLRLNTENMTGYIYLISSGRVVASYATRGKPTSLNAYLMAGERPGDDPNGDLSAGSIMIEQPDYDGAYGKNADGVFFFTADSNAYVEWHGDYLFADQPLALDGQPLLVRPITEN